MKCIYREFVVECNWENCPARMLVPNPIQDGYYMKVCALAYHGAPPANINFPLIKKDDQMRNLPEDIKKDNKNEE